MANNEPSYTIDDLLTHEDWLRRCVRQLLKNSSDESLVDDIVQDVWMVVFKRPWETVMKPRPWLAAIAQNKVFRLIRDSNEAKRIASGSDMGSVEAGAELPEELIVREEARQRLIDALTSLGEPYRGVLLLRYFSGLSYWQIARRLGIPVSTARIQAHRGREKLRAKLKDEEFRGGTLWGALPMLAKPWPLPVPTGVGIPAAASRFGWGLAGLGGLLLVGGAALWWGGGRNPEERQFEVEVGLVEAATPAEVSGKNELAPLPREQDMEAERTPVAASMHEEEWTLGGRVHLGSQHRDELVFEGGTRVRILLYAGYDTVGDPLYDGTVDSIADGSFRLSRSAPDGAVTAVIRAEGIPGQAYAPHLQAELTVRIPNGESPPDGLLLPAFPCDRTVRIEVRDWTGNPRPDATVEYLGELTNANGQGVAQIQISSHAEFIQLSCWADGCTFRTEEFAPEGSDQLVLTLQLDPAVQLEVRVTDAETGIPLQGVRMSVDGHPTLETDEEGRCVFLHLRAGQEVDVEVLHPEYARNVIRLSASGDDAEVAEIELFRGWVVEGSVVDGMGLPVHGAELTLGLSDSDGGNLGAFTDEDGHYRIEHVRPIEPKLLVMKDGFAPALVPVTGPGFLPIELHEGRTPIRTNVRTETAPVRLAKVELIFDEWIVGRVFWAGEDGAVVLDDCPEGEFKVWVSGPGVVDEILLVEEGVDLVLRHKSSLSGSVQNARTGEPIGDFLVRLVEPEDDEREATGFSASWRSGYRFFNGEFTSKGEAFGPGRLRMEVLAEGFETATVVLDLDGSVPRVDRVIELRESD